MVIFLLLVAVVTSYHLGSHKAKITNRYILRWNVYDRPGTTLYTQAGSDSISVEGNQFIVETRRVESMKQAVFNFLVDEAEYLGGSDWDVSEISNKKESICFKCTSSSRDAKSLFVKHSQQPRSEVHNRLRYEFEGTKQHQLV